VRDSTGGNEDHEELASGGIGLFVDAKDKAAQVYYERFGFVYLPDGPLQLFLPLPTLRTALEGGVRE
jgi:hypothetical protein